MRSPNWNYRSQFPARLDRQRRRLGSGAADELSGKSG